MRQSIDKLECTLECASVWFEKLDGGIEYLRSVVIDDVLGIGDELEADMARHIENYECEWSATLNDPERRSHFVQFVNSDAPDPDLAYARERGQRRPVVLSSKQEALR